MKNIKYTAKILENGVLCGYLQKLWVVIIELTDIGLCDTAKLRILGIGYNDSVFVFVFMHSNSPLTANKPTKLSKIHWGFWGLNVDFAAGSQK